MTTDEQPSTSGAQDNYPRGPQRDPNATETVYKMSSNENPLGCSASVAAAVQAAAAGLGDYPPYTDEKLRDALSEFHGRGLTRDHFITGNGGSDVLEMAARTLITPGDEVIICPPTFPIYELTAKNAGATIVEVPLLAGGYEVDVEAVLGAVTDKTRILYLCSPNNPTGTLLSQEKLDAIMAGLPDRVKVVFDEVYYHFISVENRPDPIDYVLDSANILVLHSFSKAYGLAGLRLGYGIAKPELIETVSRLKRPFHLNTLCFEAGLAALADPAHVEKTVDVTLAGRDWLIGHIRELGLEVWPSESNFVLFKCPVPAMDWAQKLEGYGILVRPAFGLPDHLRVTVGLPEANQAFVDALAEIAA